MKKQTQISAKNFAKIFVPCTFGALFLLLLSFVFIPEFMEFSFAEEGYSYTTDSVTLKLSPTNKNHTDYRINFSNPDSQYGSFGTVGINANVATANSYGYSLYLRSGNHQSRLLYGDMDYARQQYIETLSTSYFVTTPSGSGFGEMNKYGWSTDWNPATSRGTFNPLQTSDEKIKVSTKETFQDGTCDPTAEDADCGEDTQVYVGALLNDQVMHGVYKGTLIFTAIANSIDDIYGDYTLAYDMNGGNFVEGAFPTQTVTTTAASPIATFTINTAAPTHPSGYVFLGWDTNRNATTATYAYGGGTVTPNTFTASSKNSILYAIWAKPESFKYTYTLTYNANSGTNAPANTNKYSNNETETLIINNATIPTKEGFKFLGYADSQSATAPTYTYNESAHTFSPATITMTSASTTKTIYAVWEEVATGFNQAFANAGKTKVRANDGNDYYAMQDMNPEICVGPEAPVARLDGTINADVPEITLVDTRDGKTYTVRKLADGNCWMTSNLDLDLDSAQALDSSTTDLNSAISWTPENTTQTTTGTTWADDSSDSARSYDSGDTTDGNYYNWYAATAGSGTASMESGEVATDSICPRGWQLAKFDGNGSYNNLISTVYGISGNDTELLPSPLSFVRAGRYDYSSGSLVYRGSNGFYWESRASSSIDAIVLSFGSTYLYTQLGSGNKGDGFSVRCVARISSPDTNGSFTDPQGVVTSETDNGTAAIIAAVTGTVVASTSFIILLLAKRKKDEDEELNVE